MLFHHKASCLADTASLHLVTLLTAMRGDRSVGEAGLGGDMVRIREAVTCDAAAPIRFRRGDGGGGGNQRRGRVAVYPASPVPIYSGRGRILSVSTLSSQLRTFFFS